MGELKLLLAKDVHERVVREKALKKVMSVFKEERARYQRELANTTALTKSIDLVVRKATRLKTAIVLLHRRLQRLKTEKKIVLRHELAEKKEEAKLAKKMQVLKVLGGRKLNGERSDLVKAVALLKHEEMIDAT